jgi:23S rRNA pseudouridine2605 synthase
MERLQKVLAQAGIASRRAAEQIILAGRVRVDGRIVRELGTQVDPRTSRVEVDGNKIVAERLVYIVLHKPRGVVCTLSDPEGRPTIRDLLKDAGARVVPVGRLDFHTSGALLCTNDGEFAQALAHPKREVPKVYVAKVKGAVDDDALERFGERIVVDGRPTQPAQVKRLRFEGDKTWLEITLREGRNRQVRRLGEATGFPVMRLARISHAGVTSEDLRPGQWRPLTVEELVDLKRDYGVPKKVRAPLFVPSAGRDASGRGTEGRPTRGDQRGAKRPKAREARIAAHDADLTDPHSRAARSAPKRFEAGRGEPTRFNSRQGEPTRADARSAEPKRFEGKAVEKRRAESKRFDEKRSAPKRFDTERTDARGSSGQAAFQREPAQGGRRSNRQAAFQREPAQGGRVSSHKSSLQDERAHSASHNDPNRPWKTRSRSTIESRLETNSARPSADRASSQKGRRTPHAQHGGGQNHRSAPTAQNGVRASAPRRGTSR